MDFDELPAHFIQQDPYVNMQIFGYIVSSASQRMTSNIHYNDL